MRLNRYLSQCGIASRRGAEQFILDGRVAINGSTVRELATQVGDDDTVTVDSRPIRTAKGIVIALHKPKGYICTRGDTHDRATIYDLLPAKFQQLHHVGRLDKESEGLLLLTNRGDVSQRLLHPSEGVEKEYEVTIDQPVEAAVLARLTKGMMTEEGFARAERAWAEGSHRLHIILKQGLKRQIRLMLYQLGCEVERLVRIRIGWLKLKGMPKGGWQELTDAEVQRFFAAGPQRPAKPIVRRPKRSSPGSARSQPPGAGRNRGVELSE